MKEDNFFPPDFPDAPAFLLSDAAWNYFVKRTQSRSFSQFYNEIVNISAHHSGNEEVIYRQCRGFNQYLMREFLCKHYDYFLQYLQDLISNCFYECKIPLPKNINSDYFSIQYFVEKQLYGGITEIAKTINSYLSIRLDDFDERLVNLKTSAALRHLIVHNNCFVNSAFENRLKEVSYEYKLNSSGRVEINVNDLNIWVSNFDRIVFSSDWKCIKNLDLANRDRRSSFFIIDED